MSIEEIKKENEEEQISKENQNDEANEKNNEVYFLILIPSEEKLDFQGKDYDAKNMVNPLIIYKNKVEKGDDTYLEEIIFKATKKKKKKGKDNESSESTKYSITFFEEEHMYNITFSAKNECFIYQHKLEIGNKFLQDIPFEPVQQNIVPLYIKQNIFLEALKQTKEIDQKEEKLYKDTIDLYKEKKQFSLLITLFLKVYEKNKDLCKDLIEIFFRINEQENNDKVDDLKKYLKSFKDILSRARDIFDENNYNSIHFYGILFVYLHFYDEKNFPKIIEEFSEGNANILYEILIHYYLHFINPLKQKKEFFEGFIQYALKENKKKEIFDRIMNYIEDIETYLFIIDKYKEQIFKKYTELRTKPFEIDSGLKLVKYKKNKKDNQDKDQNDEPQSYDEDDDHRVEEAGNIENECHVIKRLIENIIKFSQKEKF